MGWEFWKMDGELNKILFNFLAKNKTSGFNFFSNKIINKIILFKNFIKISPQRSQK